MSRPPYGLSFNAGTGTWDTTANWTAEGYYNSNNGEIPTSGSPVYLLSTVTDLIAGGANDQADHITATGSLSGGGGNTLDVTGSLTATGGTVNYFDDFSLIVAKGGYLSLPELSLSNSVMDVYGTALLTNGGGSTLANSTIVIEAGGTMTTPELNGASTDHIIVDGVLNLTGGDPGSGGNNTINAGGTVNVSGYEPPNTVWDINGGTFVSTVASEGGVFNFTGTGGVLDLPADALWNSNFTVTGFNNTDAIILGPISGSAPITTTLVNGNQLELIQNGTVVSEIYNFTLAPGTTLSSTAGTIVNGDI